MKRLLFIGYICSLMTAVPTLQSCLDNNDNDSGKIVMCTINTIGSDNKLQDFTLDDGKKMFPDNAEEWNHQSFSDGQRAFVVFNELDKPVSDYDYTIRINQIKEVLTKEIIDMREGSHTEDNIGDDKINATYLWMSKDKKYLTIEFQYYFSTNEKKKHFLNLIIPAISPSTDDNIKDSDEYIHLEFRHNDENNDDEQTETPENTQLSLDEGYVSFKLDKIKEEMKNKKGLQIRVNTLYKGIQTYKVDFP